ncbi:hypothetical protein A9Q99_10470 [Gammaproteobacteria bacterium 45_16_T64]|nr:hypothetical protein A9Q99_10470 [Gammaproteobacteria bacterium 45_16_T64]
MIIIKPNPRFLGLLTLTLLISACGASYKLLWEEQIIERSFALVVTDGNVKMIGQLDDQTTVTTYDTEGDVVSSHQYPVDLGQWYSDANTLFRFPDGAFFVGTSLENLTFVDDNEQTYWQGLSLADLGVGDSGSVSINSATVFEDRLYILGRFFIEDDTGSFGNTDAIFFVVDRNGDVHMTHREDKMSVLGGPVVGDSGEAAFTIRYFGSHMGDNGEKSALVVFDSDLALASRTESTEYVYVHSIQGDNVSLLNTSGLESLRNDTGKRFTVYEPYMLSDGAGNTYLWGANANYDNCEADLCFYYPWLAKINSAGDVLFVREDIAASSVTNTGQIFHVLNNKVKLADSGGVHWAYSSQTLAGIDSVLEPGGLATYIRFSENSVHRRLSEDGIVESEFNEPSNYVTRRLAGTVGGVDPLTNVVSPGFCGVRDFETIGVNLVTLNRYCAEQSSRYHLSYYE